MVDTVIRKLRGEVRVRITAPFPERVLNLCGVRQIRFWDVHWVSATEFLCTLSRGDYPVLRRAVEGMGCELRVERGRGAPYFLGRFRRRHVLLAGLTLCAGLLFLGSFFIWDFTIEGETEVSREEILRALKKCGVTYGTFGLNLDGEDIRNHALLELPELSYIAVNVSGCQAHVQVRQRIPAPKLADKWTPANLVARRDGLVLKVNALEGVKTVLPGMTVEKGELLISGVREVEPFGARVVAGMGSVTARTWYTLETKLPLKARKKSDTGKTKRCFSLIFGTHRVKFFRNSSIAEESCDRIRSRHQLSLLGMTLPITVEEELCRYYESTAEECTAEVRQAQAEAVLNAYLRTLLPEGGEVRSALCRSRRSGDVLTVTLTAECVEEIGETVPILTELEP